MRICDMRNANMRIYEYAICDLRYVAICDLRYVVCDMRISDMQYANMRYASMRYANMQYAICRYAICDIRICDMRICDMRICDMRICEYAIYWGELGTRAGGTGQILGRGTGGPRNPDRYCFLTIRTPKASLVGEKK